MTTGKGFKRLVRQRATRTGESYQAARRSLLARSAQEEHVNTPTNYDATALAPPDSLGAIRANPPKYLPDTGTAGLTHLVLELIANSVDEATSGFASHIEVTLLADGGCRVSDDGRGIPPGPSQDRPGLSAVEVAVTVPHSGAKRGADHYLLPSGHNGLGLKVVTALSRRVEVVVDREGERHDVAFETLSDPHGRPLPGQPAAALVAAPRGGEPGTGSSITFWPDEAVFDSARVDVARLGDRLTELACLHAGLTFTLMDEVHPAARTRRFVELSGLSGLLPEGVRAGARFGRHDGAAGRAEVVITTAAPSAGDAVRGYVNDHPTPRGGPHIGAVVEVLTSAGLIPQGHGQGRAATSAVVSLRLREGSFAWDSDAQRIKSDQAGSLAALAAIEALQGGQV